MMKKLLSMATIALVLAVFACQTDDGVTTTVQASDEALAKIAKLGFSTENVQLVDGGYLVEGDIMLHEKDLSSAPSSKLLRIAETEQYHTFNLVTGTPRVITVSSSGTITAAVSSAIDGAIARYNAQNLSLTFQRVAAGGNINVRIVNGGNYIASAGFPSGGNPYYEVKFNKQYQGYSAGFLTTVITHEMGHCIGFRHTDYMNRSYSCGSGGNEGQETSGVGAVLIPGTPSGPDAASWMLACLSATTDRPFNSNDRTALNYLY